MTKKKYTHIYPSYSASQCIVNISGATLQRIACTQCSAQHVVLLVWLTPSRISPKQLWLAGTGGLCLQPHVRLPEDINAGLIRSQWAIHDPCMPINGKDNQYFWTFPEEEGLSAQSACANFASSDASKTKCKTNSN